MIKVSASKLRQNLFEYLDKVSQGETIIIQRNNQEVARVISTQAADWRDKMNVQLKLMVSPDELVKPMDDIWEDYT